MLCLRSKPILSPFSFRTFVEQLPFIKLNTLNFTTNNRKSLTTATSLKSSHFETLNPHQKDQISLYVDVLLQWNQKMNLTAVTERSEVMERHVEDSLAILPPINECYSLHCGSSCERINVVDVGTGAGLPGLILAIACPGWKVTLLESMNKRCLFLEHAISVTGVSNVQVIRDRAENFGQTLEFRESFDIAVARAVAELRVLAEYCIPLVRKGGLFIAAKGHDPQEEIRNAERAINLLGASLLNQHLVESHGPLGQRTAIVCFKDRVTPRKYPRTPGTPAKLPL
ncbi:Ribosomal RNA small subunit methyltransferase G [Bienertia sinuspersici]